VRGGGVVAGQITAYLAGMQKKLRAAERDRAVAEARAGEERRRRNLQAGLAAAVLALTIVGGLSTAYYLQQRQARAAAVAGILGEARPLCDQARAHAEDPARWLVALTAIRRVDDVLGTGTGISSGDAAEARRQSRALRGEVQAGLDAAEGDRRLVDRLVDIRSARGDDPNGSATDLAYADAFTQWGIDLAALAPAEAGAKIRARPPDTAQALTAMLDDWSDLRRWRLRDEAGGKRLSDAARAADPDPWRRDLRAALEQPDRKARLAALQAAARSARFGTLGAMSLDLLGTALWSAGDPATAEPVLRAAQRRHPGDVWINYDLARVCERRNQRHDAIHFYTAARAIRPETAHQLAHLLEHQGESEAAVAVFQDLTHLRPRNARHLDCLGSLLAKLGRAAEARPILEAVVAAGRDRVRREPRNDTAHNYLGIALNALSKHDEAIAEFRAAIHLRPDDAMLHDQLGNALWKQGKLDEAIAEFRAAIRTNPDYSPAHDHLGIILLEERRFGAALARAAVPAVASPAAAGVHDPDAALHQRGKLDEMIAMAGRLPAVLNGEDRPRDAAELEAFRLLCRDQGRYAAAARLLVDALAADPALGDDRQTLYRYNAACSAALAGCGESKDDPPLDEPARAALRRQALDWLVAEQTLWTNQLENAAPQARATVINTLKHWQQDADLAGVREAAALAALPEEEQAAWRALWSDVAALLEQAGRSQP
jgi:tetratricopeptide (TPR) repeat protein